MTIRKDVGGVEGGTTISAVGAVCIVALSGDAKLVSTGLVALSTGG